MSEQETSAWASELAVTSVPDDAFLKDGYKVLQLTKAQLNEAFMKVLKKISEPGKQWLGEFDKDNRPRVSIQLAAYKQLKIPASHVVLVKHKVLPSALGMHASHYCHNASCMRHLTWEPAYCNETLRKKCFLARVCTCSLVPPCRFDLH